MKKELDVFFTALMFYTRIPCPKNVEYSQEILNELARYYPLMGWIVGGFGAAVFLLSVQVFSLYISVVLSMAATILLTGCFHEDGFADVCDGFGGGMDKEQILTIMKDSRLGTFGTVGLFAILFTKFLALAQVNASYIPIVLIVGHSVSRFASTLFRMTHAYVKENDQSKSKPMVKDFSKKNFIISSIFGLLPLVLFKSMFALILLIPVVIVGLLFAAYLGKRIGGYTGDCLGAVQQLCEATFYLSCISLWKYI